MHYELNIGTDFILAIYKTHEGWQKLTKQYKHKLFSILHFQFSIRNGREQVEAANKKPREGRVVF